jgi:mono/diheme cytochrome c family protein
MREMSLRWALMAAIVLAASAACGGGAPAGEAGQPAASVAGAEAGKTTAGASASKVNMEEIFPPGAGRDLVLNNCQNCHTFVPIVVLQMEEEAWTRSSLDHRQRVNVSDEEFKTIYSYLKANFNPNRPVPKLPKELLESWTTY